MHLRLQLALQRLLQGWRWFRIQMRLVQIAVILDAVIYVTAVLATRIFHTNMPSRYAFFAVVGIWIYLARKVAVPVWLAEIGVESFRKATDLLPKWVRWLIVSNETPAPKDRIWYEASIGGHVFHILSTVWMWAHVFLLLCGIMPVWENGWFSASLMATAFILFFTATDDFIDVKTWRQRLIYAVVIYVIAIGGQMTFRLVAPGTYDYLMAKYHHQQTIDAQASKGVDAKTEQDRRWREQYDKKEMALVDKQRSHDLDPASNPWTDDDMAMLETVRLKKNDLPADASPSKSSNWFSGMFEDIPPFVILVLTLLALGIATIVTLKVVGKLSPAHSGH